MNPHPTPDGARLGLPIASLFIASMVSCALLLARDWISGSWRQLYLPWNLFLAWLPLLFAWRATRADTSTPGSAVTECARPRAQQHPHDETRPNHQTPLHVLRCCARGRAHPGTPASDSLSSSEQENAGAESRGPTPAATRDRWRFRAHALAWLLFFPNAPYILTDLWHLPPNWQARFWVDLVLILLFALIGLVLGFLSLYLMQRLVARRFGWVRGWLFTFGIAALSGCGLCIGRFLRWNSWDVLMNPGELLVDLYTCALRLTDAPRLLAVPVLFAILTFVAYVILYALTRLPPQEPKLAP